MPEKPTIEQIEASISSNDGYCTSCDAITNIGGVEPDAEGYDCEECGNATVMGIENALIMGLLA